jgi:hypothetical protein
MRFLAHRGWWRTPEEKNSEAAFRRALQAGYGIETDLRDRAGEVVISHDPALPGPIMTFDRFLDLYLDCAAEGVLALNIKADGLQVAVRASLSARQIERAFVFDMAVPDALGYLDHGLTTFTRHSEVEPEPAFYSRADGVWLDCFEEDWVDADTILSHRRAGKALAIVSPELHRRPHLFMWERLKGVASDPDIMLCTDLPDEADRFFKVL